MCVCGTVGVWLHLIICAYSYMYVVCGLSCFFFFPRKEDAAILEMESAEWWVGGQAGGGLHT